MQCYHTTDPKEGDHFVYITSTCKHFDGGITIWQKGVESYVMLEAIALCEKKFMFFTYPHMFKHD